MPISLRTIAIKPAVTCSPEATTASYSRASCSLLDSLTQPTSSLVLPDMFHGALSVTRSSIMGTMTLRSRAIDASASTQLTSEPSSGANASGVQHTTTQRALASSALMTAAKLWPASSS